jgi:hypothetical protein
MRSRIKLGAALFLFALPTTWVNAGQIQDHLNKECKKSQFDPQICKLLIKRVEEVINKKSTPDEAINSFNNEVKKYILTPDFLNERLLGSATISSALKNKPLKLEFKAIEADSADSTVLGLAYEYKYIFDFEGTNEYSRKFDLAFSSEGFITQNKEKNPRNIIEAQLVLSGDIHTDIKPVSDEWSKEFVDLVVKGAQGDQQAQNDMYGMLDKVGEQYGGFYFIKYGLDVGIESDQSFDAKNKKVSGFVYGQYDFMNRNSFLGNLGVTIGALTSVDQINPNNKTPRALLGDNSDYYRVKGEFTATLPLGEYGKYPIDLQFNYRTYQELSASDIVKEAGMDRYHLRTWSLTGPYGMYVSYSSGELPFDLSSESTVELGVKWYLK